MGGIFVRVLAGLESDFGGSPTVPWQSWRIAERLCKRHPSDFVLSDHVASRSGRPRKGSDIAVRCLPFYLKVAGIRVRVGVGNLHGKEK